MSETSLAIRNVTPSVWQQIQNMAPMLHESRIFGTASAAQAAAIMAKGHELGLPLTASFELIYIIQGKPSLSPRGALAIIHNSGEIEVKITRLADSKGAYIGHECWMRRKDNGFEYTAKFTMEDAKRADLIKKGSAWEGYPENMCMYRSVGFTADIVCPDLIGGLKRADEYGANIDPQGNVIQGEWSEYTPQVQVESAPTLEVLVDKYGAETVIQEAGGQIPTRVDQFIEIAKKLGYYEPATIEATP